MNIIYTCYSPKLKQFLKDKECRYILVGLNPNTLKTFWVYERNEQLNNLLKEWSAN